MRSPLLLATVATAVLAALARAQDNAAAILDPEKMPRPETRAIRATSKIEIDGRVDEPAWRAAVPITEFIQAQPSTGAPATERTEVRLVYDDARLYISAICYDSDPRRGWITKTIERDYPGVISEDMDAFGVGLDTFLDRRSSFLFLVNPRGGLKDGQTFNDGTSRDYGWDGIVDVKTTVHDSGWTVEMAIPWNTLRFDPTRAPQSWGVNFSRRVRRKNEVAYWAPLARRDRIFLMSAAGTLLDLPRIPKAQNLWVKPFMLGRHVTLAPSPVGTTPVPIDTGYGADAGGDVKWGITPRTTLDLTFRTDFSDADVDQEQVNLTRFPLFFPEQREFFLENSGTFTFGDVTAPGAPRSGASLRDFTLFHSRTIGLRSGRPVPLWGGARLTGRAENLEFGLLDVQSQAFAGGAAENFSVARLRRNVLRNSDVGLLVTNRQTTGDTSDAYNRALGADLNMRAAQYLFLTSYVALTRRPGTGGEAGRLAVGWRDRLWDASGMFRYAGDEFNPGMGFVRRRGIRHWYGTFGAHPRVPVAGVLEINPFAEADYVTNLSGGRETWDGTLGFGVTFRDGGVLNLRYDDRRELLEQTFQVRTGIAIPAADYHFREASASYQASEGRMLSGNVGVSGGGYFTGNRFTVNGGVSWQPDYHVTLDAS
ncbi:MAG: carbohydrate binding family 9 domain-containing protein, partial [Gemmatimonadetes bacterium]|nr:carbohydrate binding family 9 domain-containing protein [Gemmatimonadota bacterium]